tara:strand:- start:813 stop:1658 length:846 start_codon:yes stop_codon:yes gene_type:complete
MHWKKWNKFDLEKQFNPRVAIGNEIVEVLDNWERLSNQRRNDLIGEFDISYGDHPLMKYDCHIKNSDRLILINIHGGYFRAFDKSGMDRHVADLVDSDFGVINLNYPLCPEVTITEIVETLHLGLRHIVDYLQSKNFDQKIVLIGHSAGAHLSMHLSHSKALRGRLSGIIAISGVYELGFIKEISVQDDVHLSDNEVNSLDCLKFPPLQGLKYYISAGGKEPSAWIDQSWIMTEFLLKRGDDVKFHVCADAHHFNLVDRLCDGNHLDGMILKDWLNKEFDS